MVEFSTMIDMKKYFQQAAAAGDSTSTTNESLSLDDLGSEKKKRSSSNTIATSTTSKAMVKDSIAVTNTTSSSSLNDSSRPPRLCALSQSLLSSTHTHTTNTSRSSASCSGSSSNGSTASTSSTTNKCKKYACGSCGNPPRIDQRSSDVDQHVQDIGMPLSTTASASLASLPSVSKEEEDMIVPPPEPQGQQVVLCLTKNDEDNTGSGERSNANPNTNSKVMPVTQRDYQDQGETFKGSTTTCRTMSPKFKMFSMIDGEDRDQDVVHLTSQNEDVRCTMSLSSPPSPIHRRREGCCRRRTELIHVPPQKNVDGGNTPALLFADDIIACTVTFPTVITLKTDDETNALCSLSSPSGLIDDELLLNRHHYHHLGEDDDEFDEHSYAESEVSDVTSDLFQVRYVPIVESTEEAKDEQDDDAPVVVGGQARNAEPASDDKDDDSSVASQSSSGSSASSSSTSSSSSISRRSATSSSILSSNDSESILFDEDTDDEDDDHHHRGGRKKKVNVALESLALDKKFRQREKQLRRVSSGNKSYYAYLRKQEEKVRFLETSRLMMRHSMSFGAEVTNAGLPSSTTAQQRRVSESHLSLGRIAKNAFLSQRDVTSTAAAAATTAASFLDVSGRSTTMNQLSDIASSSENLIKEEEEEEDATSHRESGEGSGATLTANNNNNNETRTNTFLSLLQLWKRLCLLWVMSLWEKWSLFLGTQSRHLMDIYQFERFHTFPGICAITLYCIAHTSIYNSITSLHGFMFTSLTGDSPNRIQEYAILLMTFLFGILLCRICGGLFNWLNDTMYEGVKFDLHNRFRLGLLDAKLTSWIRRRKKLCQCMDLLGFYLCFMVVSRLIEDHFMPYVCHSPTHGNDLLSQLPSRNPKTLEVVLQHPAYAEYDKTAIVQSVQMNMNNSATTPTVTSTMISKSSSQWKSLYTSNFFLSSDAATAAQTAKTNNHTISVTDNLIHSENSSAKEDSVEVNLSSTVAESCTAAPTNDKEEDFEEEDDDDDEEDRNSLLKIEELLEEADMEYLYTKLSTYSFTAMFGWGVDVVPLVSQQWYAIYYVVLSAISVAALVQMGVGFTLE